LAYTECFHTIETDFIKMLFGARAAFRLIRDAANKFPNAKHWMRNE
jgi:hypothetical protein